MTKADLVEQVADAIGPGITKKDCALVVDGFLNAVKLALANGENIEIRGFGTFKVRKRKTRMARNPRTGDAVEVPSRSVPVFKPSKHLRTRVERLDEVGFAQKPHKILQKVFTEDRILEFRAIFREILNFIPFSNEKERNIDVINALNFAIFNELQGKRVAQEGLRSVLRWRKERSKC